MKTLPAALCGYALDCLLGDPASVFNVIKEVSFVR